MALNNNPQQPPEGSLRQQFQPQGQPGGGQQQKPGKQQKPLDARANVNAGHMLPDPKDLDVNMDVSDFTGWTDVTPHVAGGAVQIVGGVRPPEVGDAGEGDDEQPTEPVAPAPDDSQPAPSQPTAQPTAAPVAGGKLPQPGKNKAARPKDRSGKFNWGDGDLTEVKGGK